MQLNRLLHTDRFRQHLLFRNRLLLNFNTFFNIMPVIKHYPTHLIIMIHLGQNHQYTIRYACTLYTLCQVVFVSVYAVYEYW